MERTPAVVPSAAGDVAVVRERLRCGGRVVLDVDDPSLVALLEELDAPFRIGEPVPTVPDAQFPHVAGGVVVSCPAGSLRLRSARRVDGGAPLLFCGHVPVAASCDLAGGTLVVAPDLARVTSWGQRQRAALHRVVYGDPVAVSVQRRAVDRVDVLDTGSWDADIAGLTGPLSGPVMLTAVRRAVRDLPAHVVDRVAAFAEQPGDSGALLLRGCPVGQVPATPPSPTSPTGKDRRSEHTLLSVARILGHPVGYRPEHGGDIVQNILPTRSGADRQVSTSSKVTLMYHTEAAFHPWRPRWLLLLCLRGDPSATTTLVSVRDLVRGLPDDVLDVLATARFVTGIDESYAGGPSAARTEPHPVLWGPPSAPFIRFDADLTVAQPGDQVAAAALGQLHAALAGCEGGVVLEPGDLLVVDNNIAIHGRSPFVPRFDGTDRWLQRTFVVADLAPVAAQLDGRIVTTTFQY